MGKQNTKQSKKESKQESFDERMERIKKIDARFNALEKQWKKENAK